MEEIQVNPIAVTRAIISTSLALRTLSKILNRHQLRSLLLPLILRHRNTQLLHRRRQGFLSHFAIANLLQDWR